MPLIYQELSQPIKNQMQESVYHDLYKAEDTLWRSVSTRKMLFTFWKKYRFPSDNYKILELGPGCGATLKFFSMFGQVFGLDTSKIALKYCNKRGIANVILIGEGNNLPIKNDLFDLCIAVDVIEHIKNDSQIIKELHRVCAPDGLLLTVIPAFRFLWSERDLRLGHNKRYIKSEIRLLAEKAGFRIQKLSYINLFYFPLLWLATKIKKGRVNTDVASANKFFNAILMKLLNIETAALRIVNIPFGCSTIMVAIKDRYETPR